MKKIIEEYNDLLSSQYDEATEGAFRWLVPSVVAKNIRPYIKSKSKVLDIGVGTGQTAKIFVDKKANVTGVDISKKMLARAKAKFTFKKLIKYDIEKGLVNIFPQKTFDIIVAAGILEFIKNMKKTLGEMKQLTKNDGVIIFTYEMFESENTHGIKKVSPLGAGLEKIPRLLSFKVYRRIPSEIDKILKELSLKIIMREKFIGYLRSKFKIPVPYELIVVQCDESREICYT